jgi:ATP-binding cassette subfamily F protein 3
VDALVEALMPFEGTLIFISRDVHFIRALASHVVRVEAGRLRHFPGGYQYYLDKTAQTARAALTSSSFSAPPRSAAEADNDGSAPVDRKEQRRREAEHRQARSRQRQHIQKRVTALEREISGLEVRQKELTADLENPDTYAAGRAMQVNRELMEVHDRLTAATAEWEKAGNELVACEAEAKQE